MTPATHLPKAMTPAPRPLRLAPVWPVTALNPPPHGLHQSTDDHGYDVIEPRPGERVWHNGHPLTRRRLLSAGDVIRVGEAVFVAEPISPRTLDSPVDLDAVPGRSVAMQRLRHQMTCVAPDPAPCLVVGETGTGKERIVQELHRLSGRPGRFIPFNCATLTPSLADSQLFGHAKGAFTGASARSEGLFQAAEGGTLFLDEVGELPLELQAKLLRAIQEGEIHQVGRPQPIKVNVRIITATHRDLTQLVADGRFRQDLYARLALWTLRVPALRDRRLDLVEWLERLAHMWRADRPHLDLELSLTAAGVESLLLNPWPENLRGMDRLLYRMAVEPEGWHLLPHRLPGGHLSEPQPEPMTPPPAPPTKPPAPDAEALLAALNRHKGSIRATARQFQRDRRQVYRWIDAMGLQRNDEGFYLPQAEP